MVLAEAEVVDQWEVAKRNNFVSFFLIKCYNVLGDIMTITSVNNDKIKELVKLHTKKYRDITNTFFIEGLDLVTEAYQRNTIKELYILENTQVPFDVNYTYISREVMQKISALESVTPYFAVCHKQQSSDIGHKLIILDNLQDPGNLGTIIRSATAFNFDTIILSHTTVDLYNPKVIRSTKGMIFNTNILIKNLLEFLPTIKDYTIYGTDVINGINIKDESFTNNIAVIIGNEGQGVSPEVKSLCQKNIYLPMNPNCESLNAAVAASIIMYEINNKGV